MRPSPHGVEFNSIEQLIEHLNANRVSESEDLISVDNRDVPQWQRHSVWTAREKGLLAYSVLQRYPIGQMVLWRLRNGIRVPIDGRQRLTAIKEFVAGEVAIPDDPDVSSEYRLAKFTTSQAEIERGFKQLSAKDLRNFLGHNPNIVQYDRLTPKMAMDIFVRLQNGKPLTKAEVRAALGGKLCEFVNELTSPETAPQGEDQDEIDPSDPPSRHPFFRTLNISNTRKAKRAVCDLLLHEFLYPGTNKHWSNLKQMYFDKFSTLSAAQKRGFRATLGRFYRAVSEKEPGGRRVLPQLRSVHLVLTYFIAWRELSRYAAPEEFSFIETIKGFERDRLRRSRVAPYALFDAALSNAGYAADRIQERHRIFMGWIFERFPGLRLKDKKRRFSEAQKIFIWERANGKCEWPSSKGGCTKRFTDFHEAEADHIVKWARAGPTSVSNGRLLCAAHNRAPRR